jgi:hypothetical protein
LYKGKNDPEFKSTYEALMKNESQFDISSHKSQLKESEDCSFKPLCTIHCPLTDTIIAGGKNKKIFCLTLIAKLK